ncbi:MAG: cobalt-precorrin-5B (C(1))-methyltransferase [Deltaproteobacteria bacterium]|nr:cobalt-precorrin-5B (C(1))-methyltransferase [Deltaproteobacteria bacterium]MBW2067990.1 cobalt-precorrin-5B (C(1))-methyltransferase [Deltaproteobacteria bacterium]
MRSKRKALRKGFSSGTAVTASVLGSLRSLLMNSKLVPDDNARTGRAWVAPRLPIGIYLPVKVEVIEVDHKQMMAVSQVLKDGGDDPDITHGAYFKTTVRLFRAGNGKGGILLQAGQGVGIVTKEGLPVRVGEPAVNPVPRRMIRENVEHLIEQVSSLECRNLPTIDIPTVKKALYLPFRSQTCHALVISVTVEVPGGKQLAARTLNPRLGITGGISILGTTGLVVPYSHEAFKETIASAMTFARRNNCKTLVLSTGGKSEKLARAILPELPDASFIQIADFYEFSLKKAQEFGFRHVIHSVFFGKTVKMALGYRYTHAHSSTLDLGRLVDSWLTDLVDKDLANRIRNCNTARHAFDVLNEYGRPDVAKRIAQLAVTMSRRFAPKLKKIELLLFNYDGELICRI